MGIPILSEMFNGLGVFFRTRRYVAYLTVFVIFTCVAIYISYLMAIMATANPLIEEILVTIFVYAGATGTIYFGLGVLFTGLGLDNLWITERGRGHVTELKGLTWIAVSFAISVYLSLAVGQGALLFFSMFCWVGWIAFQAFLSARTSLRLATIAEPEKGGIVIGIGSFIILLIGLGIIGVEAAAALFLIPGNYFGLGDMIGAMFPNYLTNIQTHFTYLILAMGLMGLFALIALLSFFRYATRGSALNIALLTVFVAVYSGYFLFNVIRRTGAPTIGPVDVGMSLFFLLYAMSGIGRTVTERVETTRKRLRDFGPLVTFFLASGFFYVDSIIAVTNTTGTLLSTWSLLDWSAPVNYATFLFRDIAKLLAFPIVAVLSMLYYLRVGRVERLVERAKAEGRTFEPGKADADLVRTAPPPGQAWPSETAEGIKKGAPGHELSTPDTRRLTIDQSRRLGTPKRAGATESDEEKQKKTKK